MAEKIIMLACSAGMSTSMLVAKMQEEAKNRGKDYEIFAKSVADIDHQFETKKPDVLMLGPQVAYMKADVQKKCDDAGVPMEVINMTDYGMMNWPCAARSASRIRLRCRAARRRLRRQRACSRISPHSAPPHTIAPARGRSPACRGHPRSYATLPGSCGRGNS